MMVESSAMAAYVDNTHTLSLSPSLPHTLSLYTSNTHTLYIRLTHTVCVLEPLIIRLFGENVLYRELSIYV